VPFPFLVARAWFCASSMSLTSGFRGREVSFCGRIFHPFECLRALFPPQCLSFPRTPRHGARRPLCRLLSVLTSSFSPFPDLSQLLALLSYRGCELTPVLIPLDLSCLFQLQRFLERTAQSGVCCQLLTCFWDCLPFYVKSPPCDDSPLGSKNAIADRQDISSLRPPLDPTPPPFFSRRFVVSPRLFHCLEIFDSAASSSAFFRWLSRLFSLSFL